MMQTLLSMFLLDERNENVTKIILGCYPKNSEGFFIPNPEVSILIDQTKKKAIPFFFSDAINHFELKSERRIQQPEQAKELDHSVYTWVTRVRGLSYKFTHF